MCKSLPSGITFQRTGRKAEGNGGESAGSIGIISDSLATGYYILKCKRLCWFYYA